MNDHRLERRDNCGCVGKPKGSKRGYERRDNRGAPPGQATGYRHEPDFWEWTPLQVGWAVGAGIVLSAVVVIEAAKAAQRRLDAQKGATSAP